MSVTAAAVASLASIVGSMIKSRNAEQTNEDNQAELKSQRDKNQAYFDRNYYGDATQMADNRAFITEAKNALTRQSNATAGRNVVTGGSNATAAAAKEAANQAYAQTIRNAQVNAQQQKQHVQDSYRTQDASLSAQQRAFNTDRNNANAEAINDAAKAVGNVASSYIAGNTSSSNTGNTSSGTTSSTNNGSYNPANDPRVTGGATYGR